MSAEASRPWWATPEPDVAHLDGQDPVDAHRAGRRGGAADDELGHEAGPDHDPDVCGACPWCAGLRLLSATHPEVVTHVTEAAHHLTQAVRALVADLQRAGEADGAASDDAPFERIDLD